MALLPRLGWLLGATGFVAWLGWELRDGTALVVGAALVAAPVLAPRVRRGWSVPALAPLLGAAGLGPFYPAIAGFASTALRRAGLAAAGYVWLCCAELLTSDRLLFGPPVDAAARAAWARSLPGAASDALLPLASSPVLVGAAVWAAAAAVLPLVVRGRSLALDIAGAVVWGALVTGAHRAVAELAGSHIHGTDARGAAAGAALGALAAVAARAWGLWRRAGEPAQFP
ncbi:MAG: hypothetical protein E6G53_13935 [Actinobacteria bacterium]|nr:MAG: hypothetical protein E6G53_13935 [Actinomycetota bacterium]